MYTVPYCLSWLGTAKYTSFMEATIRGFRIKRNKEYGDLYSEITAKM